MVETLLSMACPIVLIIVIVAVINKRRGLPVYPLLVVVASMAPLYVGFGRWGVAGLVLVPVWLVLGYPLMLWSNFRLIAAMPAYEPAPVDVLSMAMRDLVRSLEDRGFGVAQCLAQPGGPSRTRVVVLVSADGRVLVELAGNNMLSRASYSSVVDDDHRLVTVRDRPLFPRDHVIQRVPRAKPETLADRHAEAVALCDSIGLRLRVLDGPGAARFAEEGRSLIRPRLAEHRLRLAYGFWFRTIRHRSEHLGRVQDQPEALSRLLSWRDHQGHVATSD